MNEEILWEFYWLDLILCFSVVVLFRLFLNLSIVGWFLGPLVGWLVGCLSFGWLVDLSFGWLVDLSFGWSFGWLVG